MRNRILILVLGLISISCSTYFGAIEENGRYKVNEKHWTLKNIPNEGIKRVLDTQYWYRLQYSFTNESFFYDYNNEKKSNNGSGILWFFDSGHVLSFSYHPLDDNKTKFIETGEGDIDFGSQGFYTIGSKEFEIEYFLKSNVSIGGSMDKYYYQALMEGDTLHLVRKAPFKKNYYYHYIYKRELVPEKLKDKKANW
ncbi:hypothetical protein [uncultured Aquimarina sp.]|uniref:hypothetical protein n=1 Tax=uncultured Aquimarina sp. TaxID=575652 RepID=UPI0026297090|nr:hypothetical protein [uncultured Aquimarina sp.]